MKPYFLIFILLLYVSAFGQTPSVPESNSSDVTGPKAIKLGKPAYPPEANAKRIRGAVNVRVTVDITGNVISAKALTGNSVFHPAAEAAAMQSKFTPALRDGKPIEVSGTIVFNFVKYDDWEAVGSNLSTMEEGIGSVLVGGRPSSEVLWIRYANERAEYDALRLSEEVPDRIQRSKKLISVLREKLKTLEPTEIWYFDLGYLTSKMAHNASATEREAKFYRYLEEFAQLVDNAPSGIPAERMSVLLKVAQYRSLKNFDKEQRTGIINMLINNRNSVNNSNQ